MVLSVKMVKKLWGYIKMRIILNQKLITTFLFIFTFPIVLLFISLLKGEGIDYSIIIFVIGIIVATIMYFSLGLTFLLFINIASVVLELIFLKWNKEEVKINLVYIFSLGILGFIFGFIFIIYNENILEEIKGEFSILGAIAAVTYGLLDVWIKVRYKKGKGITLLFKIIVALLVFLEFISFLVRM
jgi:hypothetical protein